MEASLAMDLWQRLQQQGLVEPGEELLNYGYGQAAKLRMSPGVNFGSPVYADWRALLDASPWGDEQGYLYLTPRRITFLVPGAAWHGKAGTLRGYSTDLVPEPGYLSLRHRFPDDPHETHLWFRPTGEHAQPQVRRLAMVLQDLADMWGFPRAEFLG
ncbi:hypothetical protein EV189_1661 [Motilibacter rhizosphaerae]|uniref:Uncharacterized protein n=1 Tax=Motilibacter rhizosphaerae TaxID=598652 RepID=A0A4Q7NSF2_9ACTN|nr:hypothetical protein [Motilibacter rhizosphaerae]RZS89884.1 hypothetical protein EV189_1661 [Motilibacter rhizosphaerae]